VTIPWLAIVVPVRNGMATVPRLLDGLDRFAATEGIEVVIVDDASTDDTAAYVRSRGYRVAQRDTRGGPAAARNHGVRVTSAPWILFFDADTVPPADTPARVRLALEAPDVVGLVGVYAGEPANDGFWPEYKATQAEFYYRGSDVQEITFLWAGMAGIKRDAFLRVGGFDERYTGADIEDVELGRRMSREGRIVLDREFVVAHHFPATLRQNARDHFQRGKLWVELYLRTGQFENYLATPAMAASRFAVVGVPVLLVAAILVPTCWPLAAGAALCAAFYLTITHRLLRQAYAKRGARFALGVLGAETILSAVVIAATVVAIAATPPREWALLSGKRTAIE
jgi:GT2 family glycosyltransferase